MTLQCLVSNNFIMPPLLQVQLPGYVLGLLFINNTSLSSIKGHIHEGLSIRNAPYNAGAAPRLRAGPAVRHGPGRAATLRPHPLPAPGGQSQGAAVGAPHHSRVQLRQVGVS